MAASSIKQEHDILPACRATPQHLTDVGDVPAKVATARELYNTKPPCFLTDRRYQCKERCPWASYCKKLVAEWLRR